MAPLPARPTRHDSPDWRQSDALWLSMRAEHVALVLVLSLLVAAHARDVGWTRFVAAFALIDVVGYLPGAIAARRAAGRSIAPIYHHLYNVAHSYLAAGVVVIAWAIVAGGPEWAMLAMPIHLSGDRGVLENFFKPASLPFDRRLRRRNPKRGGNGAGREAPEASEGGVHAPPELVMEETR